MGKCYFFSRSRWKLASLWSSEVIHFNFIIMVNFKSSGFDKGTGGKSGKFQFDCDGCILFTRRSINITNSFSFSLHNLPCYTVFRSRAIAYIIEAILLYNHSDLVTETLLSIVILATPGEYSVYRLLTKSLEHSSIHYFCFCSVKFAQFFY